ncbi:hypothetical protein [Flavobacterium sp. W21_SRS_FM6]|uniref:hypothetical protein n=1 Tax=Flavobacterium sp. W21_SRS_FM6 TaxID=3240268 RepID=UPI003F8F2008
MLVNDRIVSNNKNASAELIVHINRELQLITVTDLLAKPFRRPYVISLPEVEQKLKRKEIRIEEHKFPPQFIMLQGNLPAGWVEKRDAAYSCIVDLVENPHMLFEYFYGDSSGILRSLVKKSGKDKKFVQKSINKYFAGGGFKNALLPTYFNCGKFYSLPQEPKFTKNNEICHKSKPGPLTSKGLLFRQTTLIDKENVRQFAKKMKITGKVNLKNLYGDYCKIYQSAEVAAVAHSNAAEKVTSIIPLNHTLRISKRSFARLLKSEVEDIEFIRKCVGETAYQKDHAGKPGMATDGVTRPGARYEMDSTTADTYIRFEYSKDQWLSIGRPTIYMVIDVWSSMIVGFHVAFHGPDWQAASQAIYNAFSDKVEFCKQFDIDISEKDWPCHHVCESIVFDRGTENSEHNLDSILKSKFGVHSGLFAALYRGDAKGTVEKTFHTVQDYAIPVNAGKVEKAPRREDQHASNNALLTYKQFVQILIQTILVVNKTKTRVEAHSSQMLKAQVNYTPLDMWNYGLEELVIKQTKICDLKRRLFLLPEAEARITPQGILFKGLYYCSNEIIDLKLLDKAKSRGRIKISVRYFNGSTNHIWFYQEDTQDFIRLELTTRSERYSNILWDQVLGHIELMKPVLAANDEDRFLSEFELEMYKDGVVDIAKNEVKNLKKSTNKGMQKDTKERKHQAGKIQKRQAAKDFTSLQDQATNVVAVEKTVSKKRKSLTNTSRRKVVAHG